jgi:hypothetical protein
MAVAEVTSLDKEHLGDPVSIRVEVVSWSNDKVLVWDDAVSM